MKKFIIFPLIFLLFSCGQSKSVSESEAQKIHNSLSSFEASANISMGEIKATADINRTKGGNATVKITNPKTLSGLTFSFDKEDIKVSFLGLSMSVKNDAVLNSSLSKAIISAINKASTPHGVTLTADGDTIKAKGDTDSGEFTLLLNRNDYSLLSLTIPDLDLECRFK